MDSGVEQPQSHLTDSELLNGRKATDALILIFGTEPLILPSGEIRKISTQLRSESSYWRVAIPLPDGDGIGELVVTCAQSRKGPFVAVRSHAKDRGAALRLPEIQDAFVKLAKVLPLDAEIRTGQQRPVAETAAWLGARLSPDDARRLTALSSLLLDPVHGDGASRGIVALAAKSKQIRGASPLTLAQDFFASISRSGPSLPRFIGAASRELRDIARTTELGSLSAQQLLDLTVVVSGISLRVGEELFWHPEKIFETVDGAQRLMTTRVEPSLRITPRELLASPNSHIRLEAAAAPHVDGVAISSRRVGGRRAHGFLPNV